MMLSTNHDALDTCAQQYRSRFQSTARRLLGDSTIAQDAVQDAMVAAVRNLPRFRGDSQMSTWLGRIVINSALSRRRSLRRRREESLETLLERRETRPYRRTPFAAAGPGPEGHLLRGEIGSALRAAVEELPNDYRTVVMLRHFEGVSSAEIAARLQITPNAAKLRLRRAHQALRRKLAQRGYDRPTAGLG